MSEIGFNSSAYQNGNGYSFGGNQPVRNNYGVTQATPLNNLQALQNYMPQPMAVGSDYAPTDYSVFGGTKPAQFGGLNAGNLAPGAGAYSPTNLTAFGAGAGTAPAAGNWWDGALGKDGWGGMALGAATGAANLYMGLKQYGLARDMFDENKQQYTKNFEAQRGLTNSRLEDRQKRRNIERPDSMAAADYMAKYGVK